MFYGTATPLAEIANMEVVRPEKAGSRWQGIKHLDLITGIKGQLEYRDVKVLDEKFSVDDSQMSLIGFFLIDPGLTDIEGQSYMLGFRHSNDLKFPITLSVGTVISVCHNGMITGEYILRRKHTKGLDLEQELFNAIRNITEEYVGVAGVIEGMRQVELAKNQYERLLVEGARRHIYPWSWIGKIDAEYRAPTEDNPECARYTGTSWGLYNAFNYVMKDATPLRQAESLYKFTSMLA